MIILTLLVQSQENNKCLWKTSFKLQKKGATYDHINPTVYQLIQFPEKLRHQYLLDWVKVNAVSTFSFNQFKNLIIEYIANKMLNSSNSKP